MMLDLNGTQSAPVRTAAVTRVEAGFVTTTTISQEKSDSRAHLLTGDEQWGWRELRDYVVASIEERFGPFPRDQKKEYGVFNGFINRYGADAPKIARAAFDSYNGMWQSAPVSINRFCKGSDRYFGDVILSKINS